MIHESLIPNQEIVIEFINLSKNPVEKMEFDFQVNFGII